LHSSFFAAASWPPRAPDKAVDAERRKQQQQNQKRLQGEKDDVFTNVWRKAHFDESDWLDIRPVRAHLRISDAAWREAFRERMFLDDPKLFSTCEDAASFAEKIDHYQGCSRCASAFWHIRHEAVGQAFRNSCYEFGIPHSGAFGAMFGSSGGEDARDAREHPDLIVFNSDEKPAVIDFTVAHHAAGANRDKARWRGTVKKIIYKDWNVETSTLVPLVLTSRHTLHSESLKEVEKIGLVAARPGFARDAINRMKVAAIRVGGLRARRRHQQMREEQAMTASVGVTSGGATARSSSS
jgi:hypothetical protein